jgi:tetratricopeptide (TPR) repeat protein
VEIQFNTIQAETQKLFTTGDFTGSIKSGLAALELAKQLPPLVANTEMVQIHLNCSSAYMQMQKFPEALEHSTIAVQEAENGIKLRPGQPQAIEVLAITYGSKAFALMNNQKLQEASVAAERSLTLAESIYPKHDPRLYKPLRTMGMVREKEGNLEDAEKFFFRSYMTLSLSVGPQSTEAQMSIDELCNFMLKKSDLAGAEKFARLNYKALCDKQLDERGELILGDSASRVAQILRRMNRLPEAEELMQRALTIREEKLGQNNPLGVAYTLVQIAAIQEGQGKVGPDVEAKLSRALEIFSRVKGQTCPEVQNTLNQLMSVRTKRTRGTSVPPIPEDDVEYTVSSEKGRLSSSSTRSTATATGADGTTSAPGTLSSRAPASAPRNSGSTMAAPSPIPHSGLTDDEELAKLKFGPEDGMPRLMAANAFFEQGRFGAAEIVLAQAYEILLRQKGPNDQLTQAARQNLGVARNNGLNKLWMQVVSELVLEKEQKLGSSASSKFLLF